MPPFQKPWVAGLLLKELFANDWPPPESSGQLSELQRDALGLLVDSEGWTVNGANAIPQLPVADRRDVRLLIEGVLRFAHTALDDRLGALGPDTVDERVFQRELRQFLQADPEIGARLDEAHGRAGGVTDLGLGRIVLELKVEKGTALTVAEASDQFGAQTVQYASAGDSQVSLLVVLEATAKRAPAGVMGNEIAWFYPETTAGAEANLPSVLGVMVIRSGFPVPSSFSR